MEPAQRCVPGPGAWVDCGECFFSFREVEVEFFFFFSRERERERAADRRVQKRSLHSFSPPASPRIVPGREQSSRRKPTATDLWKENVAWRGEGGHEKIDPKSNAKREGSEKPTENRKVRSCF